MQVPVLFGEISIGNLSALHDVHDVGNHSWIVVSKARCLYLALNVLSNSQLSCSVEANTWIYVNKPSSDT